MKIDSIQGTMKGRQVKAAGLPSLGVIQAPNQTGKTTLALLCELAVMRYCRSVSPSPDPRNNNKLRTLGDPLLATIETEQGRASYELGSTGSQHENTTGLEKVLWLDPDNFFELSAKDRIAYVVAMSETMTADEAEERLAKEWEHVPDPAEGEEFQQYLARLTKEQKDVAKEERAAIKTLKAQLAGLPPSHNTAELEQELEAMRKQAKELSGEKSNLERTLEEYDKAFTAHRTAEEALDFEAKNEDEAMPDLVAQDRKIAELEGKIAQERTRLEAARERTRGANEVYQTAWADYQAALKWQPTKCPHCDKFLQEQPATEELEQTATNAQHGSNAAQQEENEIKAALGLDEAELRKQQGERNVMAEVRERIQHRAGRIKELEAAAKAAEAAVPPEPEEPATQNRIAAITNEIEILEQDAQAKSGAIEAQRRRVQLERDIEGATGTLDDAIARADMASQLLSETVARGMEQALAAGNEIARDVLDGEFKVTPKGELALRLDQEGVTVPEQAWSGAEHLTSQVALSVAVAAQQDPAKAWRVVILDDRILTLDEEKQSSMLVALKDAQERGVIDQVMILTPNPLTAKKPAWDGWETVDATFTPQ